MQPVIDGKSFLAIEDGGRGNQVAVKLAEDGRQPRPEVLHEAVEERKLVDEDALSVHAVGTAARYT